jgi:hypothetical protein
MDKATRPRLKSPTQFEQIPIAEVKRIAGATSAPITGRKRPAPAKPIFLAAGKGAKRGR